MWAIGIHMPNEIGRVVMYPGLGIPNNRDIFNAQVLVLTSILMFHFGAVIACIIKGKKNIRKSNKQNCELVVSDYKDDINGQKIMYYVCLFLALYSIPITLYFTFRDFQVAQNFGYRALFYSEYARKGASIFSVFNFMFFSCIVGLLIGSKFNKKTRFLIYIIFIIYMLLKLFSGDRSSWVFKLIILIWLRHISYRPINFKTFIKTIPFFIIGLYLLNAIISLRNTGVSLKKVVETLDFTNSPITSAFFEMGGSMKTIIVLQKYGWDIWPYNNTYILAIVGMVTNRIFDILNIPFAFLNDFFSSNYLGITWGAGFSIISEALLNFGPIFAPLFMMFLGYIISSLLYIENEISYRSNPLRFFFAASTLDSIIMMNRNALHFSLKSWFYGVFVIYILISSINTLTRKKSSEKITY